MSREGLVAKFASQFVTQPAESGAAIEDVDLIAEAHLDAAAILDELGGKPGTRYEKGDREKAMEVAWNSSPDAQLEGWKSPVLLIQGDDDRNVQFQQTVDLARRLEERNLPFEELVLPNEIHGFLRHASWVRADEATASFLSRTLGVNGE